MLSEIKKKRKYMKTLQKKKKNLIDLLSQKRKKKKELLPLSFDEAKGLLSHPCQFCVVRKRFGFREYFHSILIPYKGIRYRLQKNDQARSVFRGKVMWVEAIKGYGKTIILKHLSNYYTVYAGLKSINVVKDQLVAKGQTLGQIRGELYFELREFDEAVDPLLWFQRQ